jgi:ornithine cyclodeaminase/alanine dehydrogenase-like protein (mu-crystallin family)
MRYTVLTDDDVRRVLPMSAAVDRIESALREHAEGTMVAPPRFRVDVAKGALIFTAGAVTHYDKAVGFRVYDRFQESLASHGQVVVVFDSDTGDFKGVIVGGHLGAMRQTLDLNIAPVGAAHEAVADADVVMCATKSTTPVFDPSWLKPGAHINTVGPRAHGESELDASIAGRVQVVATDSRRQLRSYATPYCLADTPWMETMVELGDIVVGKHTGRQSPEDIPLFCTAGLSGTEVAVASEALRRASPMEGL